MIQWELIYIYCMNKMICTHSKKQIYTKSCKNRYPYKTSWWTHAHKIITDVPIYLEFIWEKNYKNNILWKKMMHHNVIKGIYWFKNINGLEKMYENISMITSTDDNDWGTTLWQMTTFMWHIYGEMRYLFAAWFLPSISTTSTSTSTSATTASTTTETPVTTTATTTCHN